MRTIPVPLLKRIKSNMQTIGYNANPKMDVYLSRARTTVSDQTYWTVETIREKEGIGDVAVAAKRSHRHFGRPNGIYEIHVDNGVVKTAIRAYPDKTKLGWIDQFEVGRGTSVAIAFDGTWKLHRKTWRLQTEEKPWIFWVGDDSVLYSQYWDEHSGKVPISENVGKVTAIRGWKELDNGLNDQGIIVSYTKKDGTLWYRNYCAHPTGVYLWEPEEQIFGFPGLAVDVGLVLLNDYRLGVVVVNNANDIYWLITARTWSGMALTPEYIDARIDAINIKVSPIKYYDGYDTERLKVVNQFFVNAAHPIYPSIIHAENMFNERRVFTVKFSNPLADPLSVLKQSFVIKDNLNTVYKIYDVLWGADNTELVFLTDSFSGFHEQLRITNDSTKFPIYSDNEGSRFLYENVDFGFVPWLIPPQGFDFEHLTVYNQLSLYNTKVYYVYGQSSDETIYVPKVSISLIITQVGGSPL